MRFLSLFVLVKLSCLPRFLFDLECVTDVFIGVLLRVMRLLQRSQGFIMLPLTPQQGFTAQLRLLFPKASGD